MSKISKKLAAMFLAMTMVLSFFMPILGMQTAYATDDIVITGITLETKANLTIPTAGDPITYPDIAKVSATNPAGYESVVDIQYCWHDQVNNRDYFQSSSATGVFTSGEWQLIILTIVPNNYSLNNPFTYPFSLGGCNFIYDYGATNYYRSCTTITISDNPDYGAPSIPNDNISGTYDSGNTFNKNIGALGSKPIAYSLVSGSLPDGISLNSDGSLSGTFGIGGTYVFTVKAENSLGSESIEYTMIVNEVTMITGITMNSSGNMAAPKAIVPITYPNLLNVSSTIPSGHEGIFDLNYVWYDITHNKQYFSSNSDTGAFSAGEWSFGFIISIPEDKKSEFKLKDLPGSIDVGGKTYTLFSKNESYAIYRTPYTISVVPISDVSVADLADMTYTGSAIKPNPILVYEGVSLVNNTDYTLSYSNNTNVGTAKITITGVGNLSGTTVLTFKINPASIVSAKVTVPDQTYTGSALTPDPTVKLGSKTLTKGTDYTVSYSNNTNEGTAIVTVTGTGNYTGTATGSFKITKNASTDPTTPPPSTTTPPPVSDPTPAPAVDDETTASGGVYSLNHEKQTATFVRPVNKNAKALKIPDTVTANGKDYKVTEIGAKACRGMKKLTTLVIGKNVAKIGKQAFEKCKKLKKITIKNAKMKKNGFGARCFSGIAAKAKFKVPKAALKNYTKWIKGKGKAPKTVTIKK